MQGYKKLIARILSMALSAAMVTTMMTATVFSAEDVNGTSGASSIGEITSFDKLEDRFTPSVGENAPDHVYGLPVALGTPAEDLQLPAELTAMVERAAVQDSGTTAEQETIPVTWTSDTEYTSDENGTFIYTAVLPEGYILADGIKLPQIHVTVGMQARSTGDAITVTINGTTTSSGATLEGAMNTSTIGDASVTSLKITAGTVTTDDWQYLTNLSAMNTFEIASGVTPVAGIPNVQAFTSIFCDSIVTVTVPQAITIGNYAFKGGTALTTVSFPAATSIGNQAFDGCRALTTANFPKATSIGEEAFSGCTTLTSASFPIATSIGIDAFRSCIALTTANFPKATSIGNQALYGCTSLATLKLGATPPITVGTKAFEGCPDTRALGYVDADGKDLTDSALTDAINAYKTAASGADKWNGWTIDPTASLTVTVNGTEYEGTSLKDAVSKVSGGAGAVTSLTVTKGKVTEDDWKYLESLEAMNTFEIASGVTPVAAMPEPENNSIFPQSIVSVTVPKVITIGTSAFFNCTALTTVSFPDATIIDSSAFNSCSALTSVSSPKVTDIKSHAFRGCEALTTASFPVATSIGKEAFYDCDKLTTLKLGATVPTTVHTTAFNRCPATRALGYVDADGNNLTGTALTAAIDAYKAVADTDDASKWHGWTIVPATSLTVTVNGTEYEGATLQEAVGKVPGGATAITSLKITAGTVTGMEKGDDNDWEYLKNLTAMTTFEIDGAVTVADMPATGVGSLFPTSIVTVTVPQAITIGSGAFTGCPALTTVSFPEATSMGMSAFNTCTALTNISLPKVTSTGLYAFSGCTALTSASFPKVTSIADGTFAGCTKLATLKLGSAAPTVGNDAFKNCPATRSLGYLAADGTALAGEDLTNAQNAYDAKDDGATGFATDGKWYGWAVVPATPPTPPSGGGGSSGGGSSTPALTPPSGGSAGGITTPGKTVIDNPVGNQGSKNTLAEAVKNAIATGTTNPTVYTNFANYTALTKDGLKAINDATAAAVKDKNVQLDNKVQLDQKVGKSVVSRITVDPVKLATVMPDKLRLGVWFDQKDKQVTSVTKLFEKTFDNKIVTVTFEQKSPLAVNAEFAAKLDLSGLNEKSLYIYSYNRETKNYTRIDNPNYWADKNGYSHITAPLGGSIIISDKPLVKK